MFRKTDTGDYYAVCLLGLDAQENLFLDGKSWNGRYVPAALRRGPFKIGMQSVPGQNAVPNILVDLDDPRIGEKTGTNLFEANGGLSPYLNQIAATLNSIHLGMQREKAFFQELDRLSLLEPITVQIKVSEDMGYTIPEVFTVSNERLLQVGDEAVGEMHRSGLLALCYWVTNSLGNTDNLLERKLSRNAQAVM